MNQPKKVVDSQRLYTMIYNDISTNPQVWLMKLPSQLCWGPLIFSRVVEPMMSWNRNRLTGLVVTFLGLPLDHWALEMAKKTFILDLSHHPCFGGSRMEPRLFLDDIILSCMASYILQKRIAVWRNSSLFINKPRHRILQGYARFIGGSCSKPAKK